MSRLAGWFCLLLLVACAGKPPAPIEDRSAAGAVRDGHHRVESGDTLYAIAFSYGLDFRQLARWNGLGAPYTIYPGQHLRLAPPPASSAAARSSGTAPEKRTASPSVARPAPRKAPEPSTPTPPAASPPADHRPAKTDPTPARANGSWLWPATGRIIRGYSPTDPSRDGIDIAGREGDAVRASAAGTVVYSGNGLIGYGELIIVKHDERWLSAYGHNRKRLVAEGDTVSAGQKIAEMGRNDRNEQVLHFEIRSNGRPVNPLDQLPPR